MRLLDFKEVIEIAKDTWYSVTTDLKIMCNPFGHDSWLCLKNNDTTILNTNDCLIRESNSAEKIAEKLDNVDVLLTQFSYGQYEGNKDEPQK